MADAQPDGMGGGRVLQQAQKAVLHAVFRLRAVNFFKNIHFTYSPFTMLSSSAAPVRSVMFHRHRAYRL